MKEGKFSRGEFISMGLLGLASVILPACDSQVKPAVKQPTALPLPKPEPVKKSLEIKGKFPVDRFEFSQAILEHDLVPTVLPDLQWPLDRMLAGVSYLKKIALALENNPQHNSSTLGDVCAASSEDFPIAFSETDTASDVIKSLAKDISDKKVMLWGESHPGVNYLIGTISFPKFQADTGWQMESQIYANADFPFGPTLNEESDITYSQYTDLQVALKMIHEYAHCRQGQKLLKQVVEESEEDIVNRNNDEDYVVSLIDKKVRDLIAHMNNDNRIDRNKVKGEISFNETRANQISQLVLWSVNKLNDGKRIPGTEDDAYPVSPNSLYRIFQRAIVTNRDPYDPAWLALYTNWGK